MEGARHIVTVSGLPGSGTSTVCDLLHHRLQWGYVNAGDLFRQLAEEEGISLAELGRRAEADDRIDRLLDARMVELARGCGRIILEGRLTGWMAVRHGLAALKVWLQASLPVRASRVGRREGQKLEQAVQAMVEREQSERRRYAEFYGIDIADRSIYDLIVDAELHPAAAVAEQIIAGPLPEGG